MAAKPTSRSFISFMLILFFCLGISPLLAAQEEPVPEESAPAAGFGKTLLESADGDVDYWFEVGEDGVPIFTQILGWEEDPFALPSNPHSQCPPAKS